MGKRKCPWVAEANKKRKGYKHSEETKAKIATSVKQTWDESPDDPRRVDDEVKARMTANIDEVIEGNKGREHTPEARRNMSEAQKRFFETAEGKERLKELAITAGNYWRGRLKSADHRDKISAGVARAYMEDRFHPEYHTERGHHHSPKANDKHYYRSSYELQAYLLLDADPNVALYITEPIAISYTYKGTTRRYIPDIYVEMADGSWIIIEVKPEYQLNWPSVQAKLDAAAMELPEGCFTVWCETELFGGIE